MKLSEIEKHLYSLFNTNHLKEFQNESGITFRGSKDIKRIGYCTNLTLETINKAKSKDVDLLVTHHDAWDFIYGLKELALKSLKESNISHYYNHLPLDDSEFGTNNSLCEKLGLGIIKNTHNEEGFYCGRIAEFKEAISFEELVKRMESILDEPINGWKFKSGLIKRVCLVCGAGLYTTEVKVAKEENCDVYITGEKLLYTIEYAQFIKMNLIVGSHTFTEIFGVESLVEKIKEKYSNIEVVRIDEEHLEANI